MDLEGMVCKRKSSTYRATEKRSPYWIKVKNPCYSQAEGREELFERWLRRHNGYNLDKEPAIRCRPGYYRFTIFINSL
jgi:hypothetical protein